MSIHAAYIAVERKNEERVIGNDCYMLAVVRPVDALDIAFDSAGKLVSFPVIEREVRAALNAE